MEVCKTKLRDVWLIKPDTVEDFRGHNRMTFHQAFIHMRFDIPPLVEECRIMTTNGVLRGINYSPNCWKLNECLVGAIYYVVVNCDEKDKELGRWESFILSGDNGLQLLKHPRYGSGYLTLSIYSLFQYKQSQYYNSENPDKQHFMWNDKKFNIWWPTDNPTLSKRDKGEDSIN